MQMLEMQSILRCMDTPYCPNCGKKMTGYRIIKGD